MRLRRVPSPPRRASAGIRHCLLTVASLLALGAPTARAQDGSAPSTLIADQVEITAEGFLVASGNVEAMQGDYHLTAERITYDPEGETLEIEGPVTLQQGDNSVILAESAALSTDLENGLMKSARVVLDQQLQLSAVEGNRVNGRYTQLYNTVASSCEVCAARPTPLWQIRARRIVHDDLEKQIYFDHARFEVMGVPVMYFPQLRMPDPSLERATGFLTPEFISSSDFGNGFKIPYFIALDDHHDLTLTPYIAVEYTQTLELRYRRAFQKGYVEFNGAVSSDSIQKEPRGYLFGYGYFSLPRDFRLSFDIESTTDDDYLDDYDYSGKDRLDSALTVQRTKRDRLFHAQVIFYESLRSDESNLTQPFRVTDITWQQRVQPDVIGGLLTYALDLHGHQRRSEEDVTGRDVARLTGQVDWRRDWVGPWGILLAAETVALVDHTQVNNDSNYESATTQVIPYGVAEIRWPWVKQARRAGHVIEPVVQLVYSPESDTDTPTDESTQLELDSGNLYSLSRFPAYDEFEAGLRANLGLSWTRYDPTGWSMRGTIGRILRAEDLGQFDGYEILEGSESDWLAEVQFDLPNRISIGNRAMFDDDFDFSRNELRFDWYGDVLDIGASYIWLEPSAVESRSIRTREWTIEADWDVNERLSTSLDWRYDMVIERAHSTTLGIEYQTECMSFDFGVERSYSEYDQDEPDTDFTFQVDLAGISGAGGGRSRPVRLGCRG